MNILVVDDDPDMVEVISMLLGTQGHKALKAFGGREGLAVAREQLPDVILLDIMMPDMDGFAVLEQLRLDEPTGKIPVIFVTAKSEAEYQERAASLGAQGYVTKPYETNELLNIIYKVSSRGLPPDESPGPQT